MKYYPNNIEQIISKVKKNELMAILFYGPDIGMASNLTSKIAASLSFKLNHHEYCSASALYAALNNMSFFSEKELIKIEYSSAKLEEETQKIICSQNIHFPIIIGNELAPSSSLRKFFENEEKLAVIACYPDEEKSIRQIIISVMSENHKQLTPEALDYLIYNLHGDRLLILSELKKLLCYIGHENKITLDHCKAIISTSIESHPDMLSIYFARKIGKEYLKELSNLLENSIPLVWILRSLSRYYQNLLIVKLQEIDGVSIDVAMNSLKPPIFFKFKETFKDIARKSSIKEVANTLDNLTKAEIEAKNSKYGGSILDNLFIKHFYN